MFGGILIFIDAYAGNSKEQFMVHRSLFELAHSFRGLALRLNILMQTFEVVSFARL